MKRAPLLGSAHHMCLASNAFAYAKSKNKSKLKDVDVLERAKSPDELSISSSHATA
jgi:hypothetical protein